MSIQRYYLNTKDTYTKKGKQYTKPNLHAELRRETCCVSYMHIITHAIHFYSTWTRKETYVQKSQTCTPGFAAKPVALATCTSSHTQYTFTIHGLGKKPTYKKAKPARRASPRNLLR